MYVLLMHCRVLWLAELGRVGSKLLFRLSLT
uniref:Uncharacterized protein n=1 Tax=Arundo donax TaxID=35708 RepID=A0A0A8YC96_ARUDO